MKPIVLVGLMGVGKSTVGGIVAERLGWPLIDSDRAIEATTGSSVRELWEEGGEAAYRRLESAVVLDALGTARPSVVAAPGGVVLDRDVRAGLGGAFVVWLQADPSVLASRVRRDDHRPLLGSDPEAVLTQMSESRSEAYRHVADAVVDADALDPEAAADRVIDLYRRAPVATTVDGE